MTSCFFKAPVKNFLFVLILATPVDKVILTPCLICFTKRSSRKKNFNSNPAFNNQHDYATGGFFPQQGLSSELGTF